MSHQESGARKQEIREAIQLLILLSGLAEKKLLFRFSGTCDCLPPSRLDVEDVVANRHRA
jgi:hypothetical protein